MTNTTPNGMSSAGANAQGMGSTIITVAKALAQAIAQAGQNYLSVQGAQSTPAITKATVLKNGPGRICTIIVTVAGSTTGSVVDSAVTAAVTPVVYVIPEAVGIYVVNYPMAYGLIVIPGTGQSINVSWS
jgi:hypothetical protein